LSERLGVVKELQQIAPRVDAGLGIALDAAALEQQSVLQPSTFGSVVTRMSGRGQ